MSDFLYRTEDIAPEEIAELFVESDTDRQAVDALKSKSPTILVGSRGVGKSFLLRVAQNELDSDFESSRVLPVYLTLRKATLVHTSEKSQFHSWILSRLCVQIVRELQKRGLIGGELRSASILSGGAQVTGDQEPMPIEMVARAFEDSWQKPGVAVDTRTVPTVDDFRDAIEDVCELTGIKRISVFFDEAAHVLVPQQQREFFTLFRDLRSSRLTCNGAVYPGVTAYGDSFQPTHDAHMIHLDRDILNKSYVALMKDIVLRQADPALTATIKQHGQNFAVLAYAANGNPRILLKTIALAPKLSSSQINEVIREFYRESFWSEHSLLADKYGGHRDLIDWGRKFIEGDVLPEVQKKNAEYLAVDKKTTAYFWLHRDAPSAVKEALRLLAYTGIVVEHGQGIKATRSEIGTRYAVNLGCLFAQEANPATLAFDIATNLTPKRMTEYGQNYSAFTPLAQFQVEETSGSEAASAISGQLDKPIDVLDITAWQKEKLDELGLKSVRDVLSATEEKLKEAHYVGEVRARRMRNAATASVFEFLSG